MAKYLVLKDTWISHSGQLAREGETINIDWPGGKEPKLGTNLEPIKEAKEPKVKATVPTGDNLA